MLALMRGGVVAQTGPRLLGFAARSQQVPTRTASLFKGFSLRQHRNLSTGHRVWQATPMKRSIPFHDYTREMKALAAAAVMLPAGLVVAESADKVRSEEADDSQTVATKTLSYHTYEGLAYTNANEAVELIGLLTQIKETIDTGGTTTFFGEAGDPMFYEVIDDYELDQDHIVITNQQRFRQQVCELRDNFPEEFDTQIDNIISLCTETGAFTLLQTLAEDEFHQQVKLENNPVLTSPNGLMIETLLDKFHKRGLLKQQHIPLIVALQLDEARGDACELTPRLPSADLGEESYCEELRLLCELLHQGMKQSDKVKTDYSRVVVVDAEFSRVAVSPDDYPDSGYNRLEDYNQASYDQLFSAMKKEASHTGLSTVSGVLCGTHFTTFLAQVEKNTKGQLTVRLLHVDSLAATRGQYTGAMLLPSLMRTFPESTVELYVSTELSLRSGSGCSYYAPYTLQQLIELPEWLAKHEPGYSDIPREQRVWQYVAGHKEFVSDLRIQFYDSEHMACYTDTASPPEGSVSYCLRPYSGCLLPLHVTDRYNESLNCRETKDHGKVLSRKSESPFTLIDKSSYLPREGEQVEGQWGIYFSEKNGSRQHQWDLPVGTHGAAQHISYRDAISAQIKNETKELYGKPVTRDFNTGLEQYRQLLRRQLVTFMLELPTEQLEKLPDTFSVANFEERVLKRLQEKAPVKDVLQQTFWQVATEEPAAVGASLAELPSAVI